MKHIALLLFYLCYLWQDKKQGQLPGGYSHSNAKGQHEAHGIGGLVDCHG